MTLIRAGMAYRLSASAWSEILRELNLCRHDMHELDYLHAITEPRPFQHHWELKRSHMFHFHHLKTRMAMVAFTHHTGTSIQYIRITWSILDQFWINAW